ncbi:MAG TPA: response regulator, partial [Desulfuromonadales bacterium]|nr:response regulator [Desulfuromonadales bacterium]
MARILVVDDERDIRLLYSAELAEDGYEVETAGTGADAAELLLKHHFDLVVLDIQMKGESGLQLLQKIVKEREDLPVILSTAF